MKPSKASLIFIAKSTTQSLSAINGERRISIKPPNILLRPSIIRPKSSVKIPFTTSMIPPNTRAIPSNNLDTRLNIALIGDIRIPT